MRILLNVDLTALTAPGMNVKFIRDTKFDEADVHFDKFYIFSDAQAGNVGNRKCYDCKDTENPKREL
jgi:hypothetical protein